LDEPGFVGRQDKRTPTQVKKDIERTIQYIKANKSGNNIPLLKKRTTTPDEIIDNKYGKKGNPKRKKREQEFEAFKPGVLLEAARIKLNMTTRGACGKMWN